MTAPTNEAILKLARYRKLYSEAELALRAYANACEVLSAAVRDFPHHKPGSDARNMPAECIYNVHKRCLDAMYGDIEDLVRRDMDDRDVFDGPVAQAGLILSRAESHT